MTSSRDGFGTSPLVIDIRIDAPCWSMQPSASRIVRRAVAAAAAIVPSKAHELSVMLTDDSAMRRLNRDWRGQDKPTNVLSFPIPEQSRKPTTHLGDIVIAYETMAHEAKTEGKPFGDHLAHLTVHGFLHLLGYDHLNDEDAEVMERMEIAVLQRLKVPNPYVARPTKG